MYEGQKVTPTTMEIKNNSTADIVVNVNRGANNARYVKVNVTENKGTVTLGKNVYTIAAQAGKIVVDASESTGSDVTVTTGEETITSVAVVGGTVATLTHDATGDVVVDNATVTTLTAAGGDITVENGGYVRTLTNNGTGSVTITDAKFFNLSNGNKGGDITITGLAGNANKISSTAKGKLTIQNEVAAKNKNNVQIHEVAVQASEVSIENVDIDKTLRFSAPLTSVQLNNSEVGTLQHNGGKAVTLKSTGNTFIKEVKESNVDYDSVEKPFMTFESKWNGEIGTSTAVGKTVAATYNVYTAAELSLLLNTTNVSGLTVNLYADIDLGEENAWKGIEAFRNSAGNKTFNGNGHKISNVNIDLTGGTNYRLGGHGFINNTSNNGKFTAKNLTLKDVKTLALEGTQATTLGSIGGFVGAQWNAGEYSGINVNGSYLGVSNEGTALATSEGAIQVGGLVGAIVDYTGSTTASETKIEKCKINVKTIDGKWSLGGLVGDARGKDANTSVKLTMNANNITVGGFSVKLVLADPANDNSDSHYGRVGMLLGTISGGASATELAFGTEDDANKVEKDCIASDSELHFGWCTRVVNGKTQQFKGKAVDGVIYVGYSDDFEGKENTATGLKDITKIDDFNYFTNLSLNARKR